MRSPSSACLPKHPFVLSEFQRFSSLDRKNDGFGCCRHSAEQLHHWYVHYLLGFQLRTFFPVVLLTVIGYDYSK